MAIANLLVKIGADIAELKTGTDAAVRQMEKTNAKIDSVGTAIRSTIVKAFTVTAIASFGKHVLATASDIQDMSERLGISAEAVQRFKFAAEQSGASLEDVGRAINHMNKALSGGDGSTVAALNDAGLSLDNLRKMTPEAAFLAVTDALKGMSDPMKQADVQAQLLGKSGFELGGAIKAGFGEVGKAATVMTNVTTAELAHAEDVFRDVANQVTIIGGRMLEDLLNWVKFIPKMRADLDRLGISFENVKPPNIKITTPDLFTTKGITDIRLTNEAIKEFSGAADKVRQVLDKTDEAAARAIQSIRDDLYGRTAIRAANDMLQAMRGMPPVMTMTADKLRLVNTTMGAALDVFGKLGKTAPDAMIRTWLVTQEGIPIVSGLGLEFDKLGEKIDLVVPTMEAFGLEVTAGLPADAFTHLGDAIKPIAPLVQKSTDAVADFARAFAMLGGSRSSSLSALGQLGSIFEATSRHAKESGQQFGILSGDTNKWAKGTQAGMAIASGAMDIWSVTSGNATKSANTLHGAVAGAKAGAAFGPYGAAVGAAAGAVIGLVRALDAGRDVVKDFAKSFGGFDALHTKLGTLGAEGERLWISLSQGVGRGNPTQAKAAVDAVTAAFTVQEGKIKDATAAVADLISGSLGGGVVIPPAIQKSIDKLIEMGTLTKENASAMLELSGTAVPSIAAITDAADRYGLKLSDLGPKVDQLGINEKAQQIVRDWGLLSDAGADVGTVMLGMKDKVQGLVSSALTFGRSLPESMRPLLEKMAEAGSLTDATGKKLEDLSGITFTVSPIDTLISKIDELIGKISGGIGGALDKLGKTVVRVPIKFDVDDLPGGHQPEGFAGGTHGRLLNFGSGRLVALHGREGIYTEADVANGMRDFEVNASGGDITVVLDAGELWDQRVVKVARKDAARGGLRTRAGHGRSY